MKLLSVGNIYLLLILVLKKTSSKSLFDSISESDENDPNSNAVVSTFENADATNQPLLQPNQNNQIVQPVFQQEQQADVNQQQLSSEGGASDVSLIFLN